MNYSHDISELRATCESFCVDANYVSRELALDLLVYINPYDNLDYLDDFMVCMGDSNRTGVWLFDSTDPSTFELWHGDEPGKRSKNLAETFWKYIVEW